MRLRGTYLVVASGQTLRRAEQSKEVEPVPLPPNRPLELQWVSQDHGSIGAEERAKIDALRIQITMSFWHDPRHRNDSNLPFRRSC